MPLPTERMSVFERRSKSARPGSGIAASSAQADLADLRRRLALGEHDLREADAAEAVEVEGVVGGHRGILQKRGRVSGSGDR
jgi:hypothetical protein